MKRLIIIILIIFTNFILSKADNSNTAVIKNELSYDSLYTNYQESIGLDKLNDKSGFFITGKLEVEYIDPNFDSRILEHEFKLYSLFGGYLRLEFFDSREIQYITRIITPKDSYITFQGRKFPLINTNKSEALSFFYLFNSILPEDSSAVDYIFKENMIEIDLNSKIAQLNMSNYYLREIMIPLENSSNSSYDKVYYSKYQNVNGYQIPKVIELFTADAIMKFNLDNIRRLPVLSPKDFNPIH